jgi:hypothetical protein
MWEFRERRLQGKIICDAGLRAPVCACLIAAVAFCGSAQAQETSTEPVTAQATEQSAGQSAQKPSPPNAAAQPVPARTPEQEQAQLNPAAPCIQPPPMVTWQEYDGPFQKVEGVFARRLERRSVGRAGHYKPGAVMCTLVPKEKFKLFARDMTDPLTFASVSFDAGISQAEDSDPTFDQGAAGYGKRFAAATADQASSLFFKDFAYPTLFHEDPRYYPLSEGSTGRRLWHASKHAFIAHNENGHLMFNFSEWLGTISAASLSNMYHPGNQRGFSPTAENVGESVGSDVGYDILREFWPEIAQKLHLPFKHQGQP